MHKKILKWLFKVLISGGFILWLIFKIQWAEVAVYLREMSWVAVVVYFVVLVAGMVISAWKWRQIALHKGINASLITFFRLYLSGTFVNNFLPSFIGGDTFRGYQLGKISGRYQEAFSSVVVDRLTGLAGGTFLAIGFFVINWREIVTHRVLWLVELGVLGAVLAGGLLLWSRKHALWGRVSRYLPERIAKFIKEVVVYADHSFVLVRAILGGMLFGLVGLAGVNYVLFWGMGIQVGGLNYLSVIFLVSIVASLPVSINNIGIKEWAYVTFFGFFGVSSAAVITVALLSRIFQMLMSFLALPYYLRSRS